MEKKIIVDEYPRPQLRRNSFHSLNGKWDFAFDAEGEGDSKSFPNGFTKEHEINVPFAYETKLSGIGITKRCDHVWYQKHFQYKKESNKRLLLHLEGSDYHTRIFLNGKLIGEDTGAYHRQSYELTEFLNSFSDDNLLIISCDDDYSKEKPRGKQRWEDKNFGCWYVDTTGIYKTVWLEEVSSTYIKKIDILPDQDNKEVKIVTEIDGKDDVSIRINALYDGKEVGHVVKNHLSTHDELVLKIGEPLHLWNVLNPEIYDLEIKLLKDEEMLDEASSYFSFRKLETKDGEILLNGKPIYQRLILDQGYYPDGGLTPINGEELLKDIRIMMDIGFNGARKHQKIEDERFYYYADMLGYITWAEMPSMYELTEKSKETFIREYLLALDQLKNHPSIITWVPFNESWGIEDILTNKDTQEFVNHVYHLTKEKDPTRFCISNDGWEHTLSDIITIHDYEQDGIKLKEKYPDPLAASVVKYEWRGKSAFAEGYSYHGEPMMLTEFGGSAYKANYGGENESWGYGEGVTDDKDYLHRLSLLVDSTLDVSFFVGYCYTQLSDVEQEVNGIVKTDRTYKLAKEDLKKIFSK